MGSVRGLRTRLCPKCSEITPHRTLYVRSTSNGKRRWFQLFWACMKCGSLNHIVLPAYRLERATLPLPSSLAVAIVNALEAGSLDSNELITTLRRLRSPEIRHIFNSEVALAVEFLKGRGIVAEEDRDCTERILDRLRAQSARSKHMGTCPTEASQNVPVRSLVSLYLQRRSGPARAVRFVPVGALCVRCHYHRTDL